MSQLVNEGQILYRCIYRIVKTKKCIYIFQHVLIPGQTQENQRFCDIMPFFSIFCLTQGDVRRRGRFCFACVVIRKQGAGSRLLMWYSKLYGIGLFVYRNFPAIIGSLVDYIASSIFLGIRIKYLNIGSRSGSHSIALMHIRCN